MMGAGRGAAIYARISEDRDHLGVGVERQEHECRQLAGDLGVEVTGLYVDDDRSAYSGKPRPAFQLLLADIAAGAVGVVIAWHPDRLYRRQRDLVAFIDTVQTAHVQVATVTDGLLDLSTATGRMIARVVGAVAEHDSELKSERIRAKHAELRRRGHWNGSRTFGYLNVGGGMLEVDPVQAAIVREVAERLLHGATAYELCQDLTRRGVATARGGLWQPRTLRSVVTKPAIFGYRTWDWNTGEGYLGVWEPILDRATVERLRLVLDHPPTRRRTSSPVALLTGGVLRCGRCGFPLYSAACGSQRPRVYVCRKRPQGYGCGGLQIAAASAEATVEKALLDELARDVTDARAVGLPATESLVGCLVQDEARLRQLAASHAAGGLTRIEWRAARRTLIDEIHETRDSLARIQRSEVLRELPTERDALASAWEQRSLHQRQAVLRACIDHIDVRPARRLGRNFDTWRILDGIVWVSTARADAETAMQHRQAGVPSKG